jgi:hypothetical protein
MGKKHNVEQREEEQSLEGGDPAQQEEVQSTDNTEQDTAAEAAADDAVQAVEVKTVVYGIGQFVRHFLKNSTKSNAEILELVLKTFPGSKTTPACIAWYKTDMRKKGLLDGLQQRGKNKVVEFTAEQLEALAK